MTKQSRHRSIRIDHSSKFIADTHFSHPLLISKDRKSKDGTALPQLREFDSMPAHDEAMVESWNDCVRPTDTIYHLGDFGWWRAPLEDLERVFKRLNGRKILVVGNHDSVEVQRFGWEQVIHGVVHWTDSDGQKIIGSHHPSREWDGWHSGALHFHGHTHNTLPSSRRSMDIGVDHMGRWPLNATEIRAYMQTLPELSFVGVPVADFMAGSDNDDETLTP